MNEPIDRRRAACRAARTATRRARPFLAVLLCLAASCGVGIGFEGSEARLVQPEFADAGAGFGFTADAENADSRATPGRVVASLDDVTDGAPSGGARPAAAAERKLVREATLTVRVPRGADAVARFEALVTEAGGYVVQRDDLRIVARVPADRFDAALDAVRAMGRVLNESLRAMDVTEQHRDLTIRLENARKSRERLLALLERATEIEDVIKIEAELRRLTTEIETMSAELEALDLRIATSLLEVQFLAPDDVETPIDRDRPSRFRWINLVGPSHVLQRF
ncbi:MAG: DUF4349 domain-containing protein [Planctomycetes bacterium]|nr:DUF4349 domain-containing protein [Planctomycetota bacterium]